MEKTGCPLRIAIRENQGQRDTGYIKPYPTMPDCNPALAIEEKQQSTGWQRLQTTNP
ncbi:hypothetical protein XF_0215 [Xylella fastidiosa 9a5c]|uniref:Uncharacterized protein n=1 Tax=Xylella fastidiosa (strain 9a5c) TaxID=160492 RepID=Q9PGT3_XYLFA|nr:hypothetical protein [Xylella fastidiosa]AAF83028.1 hypothetical protein XF_0215 [Xylella fastidiosa 9a5c]